MALPTALVTGASSGIGAVYADRFARRGHPLVLVARRADELDALADRLRGEAGVAVDAIVADLADAGALAGVEARLRDDARIGILVNNAGTNRPGGSLGQDGDTVEYLIRLNVIAPARLVSAVLPRFAAAGEGAIVNVASAIAVAPEASTGAYGATKGYMLTMCRTLQNEVGPKGIYVQAVLPAATRTDIWKQTNVSHEDLRGLMDVGDLVDAALVGFDRREPTTVPHLHDEAEWHAFEKARRAMMEGFFTHSAPAPRYGTA